MQGTRELGTRREPDGCCRFGYIEMGEFGFTGGLKKEGTRDKIKRRERN